MHAPHVSARLVWRGHTRCTAPAVAAAAAALPEGPCRLRNIAMRPAAPSAQEVIKFLSLIMSSNPRLMSILDQCLDQDALMPAECILRSELWGDHLQLSELKAHVRPWVSRVLFLCTNSAHLQGLMDDYINSFSAATADSAGQLQQAADAAQETVEAPASAGAQGADDAQVPDDLPDPEAAVAAEAFPREKHFPDFRLTPFQLDAIQKLPQKDFDRVLDYVMDRALPARHRSPLASPLPHVSMSCCSGVHTSVNVAMGSPGPSYFSEGGLEKLQLVHIVDGKTLGVSSDAILMRRPWRYQPRQNSAQLKESLFLIFGHPTNSASCPIFASDSCVAVFDGRSPKIGKEISSILSKCLKHVPKDRRLQARCLCEV